MTDTDQDLPDSFEQSKSSEEKPQAEMSIWQRYRYNHRLWRGPVIHERPDMYFEQEKELVASITRKIWQTVINFSGKIDEKSNHPRT